jgi:hypothetical protein
VVIVVRAQRAANKGRKVPDWERSTRSPDPAAFHVTQALRTPLLCDCTSKLLFGSHGFDAFLLQVPNSIPEATNNSYVGREVKVIPFVQR